MAPPLPPSLSFDDVKLRVRKAYSDSNVRNIQQAVLKEGPQVFKLATLLEIINPKTGEFHHYSLKIDHIRRTKVKGWFAEPDRSARLEGESPDEIRNLFVFLSAVYSGELKNRVGELHILTSEDYHRLENVLEAVENIPDSDRLQLVKGLLKQLDASTTDFADFAAIFRDSEGETVRHIAAASRMVEYTAAYEELKRLIEDPGSSEHDFQRHLEENPWMFGSEYSELLPRRRWTRDENLDYMLRRTVDGYLEIIEIKTAFSDPLFLRDPSHNSYYPSAKLSPVIGQIAHYIEEVERHRDSIISHDGYDPSKIRARAIVGRDGDTEHQAALHRFNAHLHRIEVITYDQLLRIARRVLEMFGAERQVEETDDEDDIPF